MYRYDNEAFMNILYEGVYIVDKNRKIVFWNSGSEKISGYKADEVVNKHCFQNILKHVDKTGKKLCLDGCPLHDTLATGKINEAEVFLEHKLGYRVPVKVKSFPLFDENQNIVAAVEVFTDNRFNDDQYLENQSLRKALREDDLTKIYNRKYLEFRLNQMHHEYEAFDQGFGILFIDADYFKKINDTYGHNIGDEVLKVIAQTLKSNMRPNDMVGRWGGEEFIVITRTNRMQTLRRIAERLRQLSENSVYKSDQKQITFTVSIGGTLYEKGETVKSLINRADKYMYEAKHSGKNKTVVKK